MSMRPSPSESATVYKLGTVKTGNDCRKWEIVETRMGIKRWTPLAEKIEMTDKITVTRNNSSFISKKCWVDTLGNFELQLASKYVPEADGEIIKAHLSKLAGWLDGTNELTFKYLGNWYSITFKLHKIAEILKRYVRGREPKNWTGMDSLPITPEHNYGTLMLLTTKILKRMPPGRYYIAICPHPRDYLGKNIRILNYRGIYKEDGEFYIDGTYQDGRPVGLGTQNSDMIWSASLPVHIIYDIRPRFKRPEVTTLKHLDMMTPIICGHS